MNPSSPTWGRLFRALTFVFLVLAAFTFVAPFLTCLSLSFKSADEISKTAQWALPKQPTLENYVALMKPGSFDFPSSLRHSFLISALSTLGMVLSSSLVAYTLARLKFRGRDKLLTILVLTMMLPGILTLVPSYLFFARLHWVDTFLPLIVPAWFGGGFSIFLLRQFYMGLPRDLDESAFLDGASHIRVWWQIILPSAQPALITVALLSFVTTWRDLLGPLVYLNDPAKTTIEQGLAVANNSTQPWSLLMAGSILTILPLAAIYLIGQKYLSRGMVLAGIR